MTDYPVAANEKGARAKTLVANQVDTFTFTRPPAKVSIYSDGQAAVYVTTDGTTPTVGGANTDEIPAVKATAKIEMNGGVVKVKSAGTPTITVSRAD